ncbi:AAA family ATPase [Bacillus sp. ISL-35]|uniref:ATP-binding protein n=1 Tax=Bacillus sp. ISL-35 TaxID=2819122 RepID=UPI001BE7B836|nr:ATP-binding protein [Bacillus sp. ISL-35]MBT2679557.1 AAA family ATPase [Bacillus sp. ISL-35]MBT2703460.1 AAA family ATPase [Chryseobacterium sp. ISL-80]
MEQANQIQVSQNLGRPIISKGSHPIETGRYLLATNEIQKLYLKIQQCLNNRFPGAIIYGRPRLGKTRAIKYLTHILPNEFDGLPIYFITCRKYKNPNEAVFFEDLLIDVGHGTPFSGKANVKRQRLLKFLIQEAEVSRQKRIVLFIDDAQRLHEIQYGWLMDINNELDRFGVSLTVFLVGQQELLDQRSVFLELGQAQIIGRFMVQQHKFEGVCNRSDMYECLLGYDEDCEFPSNSGVSFTKYYFPEAFVNGFRLANYTDELMEIYTEMRREAGLSSRFEIPMQYLTLAIEFALKKYGVEGEDLNSISKTQWIDAIKYSSYIESELYSAI